MNKQSEVHSLPAGTYTEHTIPKCNGKVRKICAPDADLLRYQRSKLPDLYRMFTARANSHGVADVFHGFVPDKNCVTAARAHIGYDMTLMMDISEFFDSVQRSALPSGSVTDDTSFYHAKGGYCAQGYATSPILANIAIIPIIKEIQDFLNDLLGIDNFAFTIYADDLQISLHREAFTGEFRHFIDDIIAVVSACFTLANFRINSNKTRLRHAKYGYRRILGINVGNDHIRASRKTMRKLRAAKHQGNGPSAGGLTTWSKCYPPKSVQEADAELAERVSRLAGMSTTFNYNTHSYYDTIISSVPGESGIMIPTASWYYDRASSD